MHYVHTRIILYKHHDLKQYANEAHTHTRETFKFQNGILAKSVFFFISKARNYAYECAVMM